MFLFAAAGGIFALAGLDARERRLQQEERDREEAREERAYRREVRRAEEKLSQQREEMRQERARRQREQKEREEELGRQREAMTVRSDLGNYNAVQRRIQTRILKQVSNLRDVPKLKKKSFAIAGRTCAGKTTTFNKMFGLNLKSSPLRNTSSFEQVLCTDEYDGYDVFGTNDRESYIQVKTLMSMKAVHTIVCLYTDCVENVLALAKLMQALRSTSSDPFKLVFVRNKMDIVDASYHGEIYKNDIAELRALCPDCELVLASNISGMGLDKIKARVSGFPKSDHVF